MRVNRLIQRRGVRGVGIAWLVLGLVPSPLPQPDYHNIRHHDGPGEVCEFHDHLLRWHPGAGRAEDVAILHWHWFFLAPESDDHGGPTDGPALHAHVVVDGPPAQWNAQARPSVEPPASSGLSRPAACPLTPGLAIASEPLFRAWRTVGTLPPTAFSATFAPRVSIARLLQHWAC